MARARASLTGASRGPRFGTSTKNRAEMHVPPRVIRPHEVVFECLATAPIPTRSGEFQAKVFTGEHVALVHGDVSGREGVLVRVHSECMTSEVFGSLRCDCKEQLDAAMEAVVRSGSGAVLYLRQEGRGI